MRVIQVDFLFLLFAPGCVLGIIKTDEKNIIREEERRGSGLLQHEIKQEPDQDQYASFKRDTWAIGLNPKHQLEDCPQYQPSASGTHQGQDQEGYGLAGPDDARLPQSNIGQFITNTRINEPAYGFAHSSGGVVPASGYGGGGLSHFGYGGVALNNFGYEGGINTYGHSAVGHDYALSGGGFTGLTDLIHKKISLKKLILPIAAIALLGAAAAMTTNPVLLQLGTISGRKRRSISGGIHSDSFPLNPFIRPNRVTK